MYGIFRSLVLSEIAIKHIDVYGTIVVLNRRLSQEFVRKSLAKCFTNVKYTEVEIPCDHTYEWYITETNTLHRLGYLLHRDNDLPAVIRSNRSQHWYHYGKLHRDNDQPAVIYSGGSQEWYQHGKQYYPK